jgi:arylsulfatase A-like enzyme
MKFNHISTLFLASLTVYSCANQKEEKKKKPNILFIAVDDLRPQLGCYGNPQIKTPNMDLLAADGAIFNQAYCNIAVSGASRGSILTGLYPTKTRFTDYKVRVDIDAPGVKTMPQLFKENGYITMSLGKVFHHPDDALQSWSVTPWRPDYPDSLTQQVNWKDYQSAGNKLIAKTYTPENEVNVFVGKPFEWVEAEDDIYYDGKIANRAVEELAKAAEKEEPFFLAVGFLKPHLPFNAPKKYWDMYSKEDIQLAKNPFMPENAPSAAKSNWGELRAYYGVPKEGPVDDSLEFNLVHGYYACTSYTDAMIGKLLAQLKELDLEENTIVILWGDHGWLLGEHGLWCKHSTFEKAAHCPVLLKGPGINPYTEINSLIEYVDLYPSLCEFAGIPLPDHLDGRSFVPLLNDQKQQWKDAVYNRYGNGETIKTERFMYTEFQDDKGKIFARMLYDHSIDPEENKNIAEEPENATVVEELSSMLNSKISVLNPAIR